MAYFSSLWEGLFIILVWIGLWNLFEIGIDKLVDGNISYRVAIYLFLTLLGIFLLWYFIYRPLSKKEKRKRN